MTDDDGAVVSYTLKELLTRLDAKIDNFLDSQHRQDQTLADHGNRISALEAARTAQRDSTRFKLPMMLSIATTFVSPFLWWAVSHLH